MSALRYGYFGPEVGRKPYEVMIPTPVGELCLWCHEAIEAHHAGTMVDVVDTNITTIRPQHYECALRAVIGSVAHQRGACSCYDPLSTVHDPEGMTARQAAVEATRYYHRHRFNPFAP